MIAPYPDYRPKHPPAAVPVASQQAALPASGNVGTAGSVQGRRGLAVMPWRGRRAMLVDSQASDADLGGMNTKMAVSSPLSSPTVVIAIAAALVAAVSGAFTGVIPGLARTSHAAPSLGDLRRERTPL